MSSLSRVYATVIKDLKAHDNADNLNVGEYNGLNFVVNKNDTREGDWRLIVPFDIICDNADWVSEWVRGKRIKPAKIRGQISQCVCIPLPPGEVCELDEDVTERFNFSKYDPEEEGELGEENNSGPPGLFVPKYDVESLLKYKNTLEIGETVVITEKIEGEAFLAVWWENQFWVRSRKLWKVDDANSEWWKVFRKYEWSFLQSNPGLCVLAEKYGKVGGFQYGLTRDNQSLAVYDFYDAAAARFLSYEEFARFPLAQGDITAPPAPILYYGEWRGIEEHISLAEGVSTIDRGTTREGFVVEPISGRLDYRGNRIKYKLKGENYLIKKGKQK